MKNIAIIGAGLAGLTVAHYLKPHANVTVFEKSRGVGGRMSTRRAKNYSFDHGAQFFKAKTKIFNNFIEPMVKQGIIKHWDARFVEINNRRITQSWQWDQQNPHYVAVPGMNAIGKYLARDIQIKLETRIQSVNHHLGKWFLKDTQNNLFENYDILILAIPAEQAAAILPPQLSFYSKVTAVTMQACFSMMLGFEHPLSLGFDAALVHNEDISWISVNHSKPGRQDTFCLLIHSTNAWADQHIDDDQSQVIEYLSQQISAIIQSDISKADHCAIHGWRYANINKHKGQPYLFDNTKNIGVCGDWLIHGRVEAAFTSGYELAQTILEML